MQRSGVSALGEATAVSLWGLNWDGGPIHKQEGEKATPQSTKRSQDGLSSLFMRLM